MDHVPESSRRHTPSRYVWQEAHLAAGFDEPWKSGAAQPLVVVAEAEERLRALTTLGLAEDRAEEAPAFRVEAVATPERLLSRLRRGGVSVVLCGALPPLADGRTLEEALTDEGLDSSVVLMVNRIDGVLAASLQHSVQARRLGEAMVRLLQRASMPRASW